jgi:hypothetical protein
MKFLSTIALACPGGAIRTAQRGTCLLAIIFFFLTLASAQSPNVGAIRGQVVDQTGAAISDCDIVIQNESMGLSRTTHTESGGYYSIEALPLTGRYKLSVSKSGFAAQDVDNIELRAGETATFNVTMAPSGVSGEITVFGTVAGWPADSERSTRPSITATHGTTGFRLT